MAKDLGNYAELRFTLAAYEKGYSILRPFSDCAYDFVLERQGRFIRVQVKSCNATISEKGFFPVGIGRGRSSKTQYTILDCDVLCIYLRTLDIFYLIPIDKISTVRVNLAPLRLDYKFNEFKENWNI